MVGEDVWGGAADHAGLDTAPVVIPTELLDLHVDIGVLLVELVGAGLVGKVLRDQGIEIRLRVTLEEIEHRAGRGQLVGEGGDFIRQGGVEGGIAKGLAQLVQEAGSLAIDDGVVRAVVRKVVNGAVDGQSAGGADALVQPDQDVAVPDGVEQGR